MPIGLQLVGTKGADEELLAVAERLRGFESQQTIRVCINRYMALCDVLDTDTRLDELAGLFTHDAVWEGKEAHHAASFGGYRGREAIRAMFSDYMKTPAHFALEEGQWRISRLRTCSAVR